MQALQYRASRRDLARLNMDLDANVAQLHASNQELARKNVALVEMGRRSDRIFSALGEALPGKVLAGKYELHARIGSGGFAIVFRATHIGIDRAVAVKIFRPEAGNDSAASLERFQREGMMSSRVRHPNIVDVLDAGVTDDDIPYIVMELLDGHPLEAELVGGQRLALERIAPIMEQVCLGLAAAEAAGVIHRDVKPENIFLHREQDAEVVKVLDFGIAKLSDGKRLAEANFTSTGDLLGSPRYMAPERILGEDCNASADVYSDGVILFRALVGRPPFEGTIYEVLAKVVSHPAPDIGALVPTLPRELADAVMRALADDPRARPSAAELADILGRTGGSGPFVDRRSSRKTIPRG
jgi:serine/threonine protein kinase